MKAIIVLKPEVSKALLAEAIIKHPSVKSAFKKGWILLNSGSTNSYIASRLTGKKIEEESYCAGKVKDEKLNLTLAKDRVPPIYFYKSKPSKKTFDQILPKLGPGDVFIKGFNAIDVNGNTGVWVGGEAGGTLGKFYGTLIRNGCKIIMVGGLEKLVVDVLSAVEFCNDEINYFEGLPSRMFPVSGFEVFTELEALYLLFDLESTHLSSGGVKNDKGSIALGIDGTKTQVTKAMQLIKRLKKK